LFFVVVVQCEIVVVTDNNGPLLTTLTVADLNTTMDADSNFRARVDSALVHARRVLENTRNPTYAGDVSHQYSDKYLLTGNMLNT
jgi:hypothetical protein